MLIIKQSVFFFFPAVTSEYKCNLTQFYWSNVAGALLWVLAELGGHAVMYILWCIINEMWIQICYRNWLKLEEIDHIWVRYKTGICKPRAGVFRVANVYLKASFHTNRNSQFFSFMTYVYSPTDVTLISLQRR